MSCPVQYSHAICILMGIYRRLLVIASSQKISACVALGVSNLSCCSINDNENMSQKSYEARFILVPIKFILMGVVTLFLPLQTDVLQANNNFWSPSSPTSSSSNNGKKRSATDSISTSSIIPIIIPKMTCFVPDEDIPLKANDSLDPLEVIKLAVHTFDKNTIERGSSHSYKSSKHLRIDYEQYKKVPWENDLVIKQSDNQNPLSVLEFLTTAPPSILKENFKRVLDYARTPMFIEVGLYIFHARTIIPKIYIGLAIKCSTGNYMLYITGTINNSIMSG
ncbi:14671_t:CDS:2 [Funneliformis mosseae]|uniref:14671_t:CDS:1 n=1 Tax=Funneliformis mosseae TaxID=27381 RepID=A0A9N9ED72_FUNMO|nr:14671_t:CDS:2 [Funneliformis mosseae]